MHLGFWTTILRRLVRAGVRSSLATIRVQGAIAYLKLIRGTRRAAIVMCLAVLCMIVLGCGFLLVPLALCLFMPWAPETKAIVAASVGAAYVVVPLVAALALFSEKRWMKFTRADKLMKAALRR